MWDNALPLVLTTPVTFEVLEWIRSYNRRTCIPGAGLEGRLREGEGAWVAELTAIYGRLHGPDPDWLSPAFVWECITMVCNMRSITKDIVSLA